MYTSRGPAQCPLLDGPTQCIPLESRGIHCAGPSSNGHWLKCKRTSTKEISSWTSTMAFNESINIYLFDGKENHS